MLSSPSPRLAAAEKVLPWMSAVSWIKKLPVIPFAAHKIPSRETLRASLEVRMERILLVVLLLGGSGCGGTSPGGGGGGGGGNDMTMGGGGIPDPGTSHDVDNNFGNVEPNDTPGKATPLGVASMANVQVWVSGNMIGGGDATDYFVFKTAAKAGEFSLGQGGLCFMAPITGLSATLWKVSGGQQVLPAIHQWTSNATCLKSMPGDAPTEASTVYLLGVTAIGGAGMYSA